VPQLTDTYARDAIHRDEEVSCSVSFTNSNTGALYYKFSLRRAHYSVHCREA